MAILHKDYKKKIFFIILCLFISILLVLTLYMLSEKANHRSNGFIRLFPPTLVEQPKALDVKYNSYYIAGATKQHIYLGNYTASSYIVVSNYALSDTQHLHLNIPDSLKSRRDIKIAIDSPNTYLMGRSKPVIGSTTSSAIRLYCLPDSLRFFNAIPISQASFVLRIYDPKLHRAILIKQTLLTPNAQRQINALEKQIDGIFCTDGMLSYDPATARLVYVYYYRNQFICMDTSLNVLYRGRTIDTISQVKIKLADMEKPAATMSAPPLVVNKQNSVAGGYIFVHSNLLANNEQKKIFEKCSVIDIYSLKDGHYVFSFYLPDYKNKKISDFRIFNKTLIALHDHYLLIYRLNF